jgi:hypothetical protein
VKWIRTKDRQPEPGFYLIAGPKHSAYAQWDGEIWLVENSGVFSDYNKGGSNSAVHLPCKKVTYWMPLPIPPKKGE